MKDIHIIYISISGNTRAFIQKLTKYAHEQQQNDAKLPKIISQEVHLQTTPHEITEPFFAFVPTYLEGGNGIDNGDVEILTEPLREFLRFNQNAQACLGIVGSGNRNFNHQYCLTAKQYAQEFQVPLIADFELRGTTQDVEQIYQKLRTYLN
ncbi:class Ib ribonucleoside-diphosphate reductase assembly flavoprotein NrdI [Enterococcus columbae]|uniref:NrdI protein n=1 Tax=Enterococcus columbae DSM 7374 = ATCC 51263 TaxID=1121865 RepID=S0KJK2_9ENTE|nr:class Ib ribonucleoside-diphosphate reductase assembly flavoprotein NrdI [Enterococcus columbae]EOT44877.1 nrdI protein [Enterococcus columbae DSM 7374 = ATCC 51263]EOW84170.1 nrdI protein [Enterococcus columbae DSM 7374 = ATCC 51263]OJG24920.1 nrdI protein [Enterococcus columbae DSM 7374 = ATCC 51263]